MLRTHLHAAWRTFVRHRTFSILNIVGLAISLSVFVIMALYIEDELSYDRFHSKASQIYRVVDDKQTPDVLLHSAQTAAPVAPALLKEFPEVKHAVRFIESESLIKYNDKIFEERKIFYSDEDVFEIFSWKLLAGDAASALKFPRSIVISSSSSKKYFGAENPVGKMLQVDGKSFKVTGLMQDLPANSHIQFDFLVSMKTAEEKNSGYDWMFTNWYSSNFYTYILLPEEYAIDKLQSQMKAFDLRHRESDNNTKHNYQFEALSSIYLHSDRDNQIGKTGNMSSLYAFAVTAFFILIIACINFINLSTARSVLRAKEVAVKKVAGAARSQMAMQFFTESLLMCGIALFCAITVSYIILPWFNEFSGKQISLDLFSGLHIGVMISVFLLISFLSGLYPAVVLSRFNPVQALKGKVNSSAWGILLRKGLVVFQFGISVVLIVCSIVVYNQMKYMRQKDLGFKSSQTMVINFEGDSRVKERMSYIKNELLKIQGVKQITASSNIPGDGNAGKWSMNFVTKTGDTIRTELPIYTGDYNFLSQYDIPVIAGRGFSEQFADDSITSMLINESAVKQLGFASARDAIGVTVGMYPNDAKVTGVIKDFHFESLQNKIQPLAMRLLNFRYRLFSVRLEASNLQHTLTSIEKRWNQLVPERPIEYSFLDDNFQRQYQSEIRFGQVFAVFTVLAVLIACLGLFGLALFSVQQRRKEVGVRKVLGANMVSIVATLSKDFVKLVSIAIIIACPLAYYFMKGWLVNFAYRVDISIWIYLLAGAIAIFIALITIGYQTMRAAVANPVKSLRSE